MDGTCRIDVNGMTLFSGDAEYEVYGSGIDSGFISVIVRCFRFGGTIGVVVGIGKLMNEERDFHQLRLEF